MSETLTFYAFDAVWWPFLFILLAGWLPTDIWRYLGVLTAGRLDETSPAIALVRAIATALVAAVIARLVIYPTGSLAMIPDWARYGALAIGFLVYAFLGRRIVLSLLAAELFLIGMPFAVGALAA